MKLRFKELLENCPVIAAVKDAEGLEKSCNSQCNIVFILFGDLCNIGDIIAQVKHSGRTALVHMDLVSGLSSREISVDWIHEKGADGIISTKQPQIKRAKELGMYTVHRFFLIDSMAYENVTRQVKALRPDCVELLPGVMPKVIKRLCETLPTPVIAGGLLADKEDVMGALNAGAISVSTTREELWFI